MNNYRKAQLYCYVLDLGTYVASKILLVADQDNISLLEDNIKEEFDKLGIDAKISNREYVGTLSQPNRDPSTDYYGIEINFNVPKLKKKEILIINALKIITNYNDVQDLNFDFRNLKKFSRLIAEELKFVYNPR
jgi:hypothetical protein